MAISECINCQYTSESWQYQLNICEYGNLICFKVRACRTKWLLQRSSVFSKVHVSSAAASSRLDAHPRVPSAAEPQLPVADQ